MLKKISFRSGKVRYVRRIKKKRFSIEGTAHLPLSIKSNFSVKKQRIRRFRAIKLVWARSGFNTKPLSFEKPISKWRKKRRPPSIKNVWVGTSSVLNFF